MSDKALLKCLVGRVTPSQWYEILNDKVFFWVTEDRVDRLLDAKAYRNSAHTVLTLDTASMVAAHRERILLSPINSGSAIMNPQSRGMDTFRAVAEYPFAEWRKKASLRKEGRGRARCERRCSRRRGSPHIGAQGLQRPS